jgi:HSP20 family protein
MRTVMDRVLEDTFRRPVWAGNSGDGNVVRPLPVDAYETADTLTVRASAPGAAASDVNVTFEQGTLTIRVHVAASAEGEEAGAYHWMHRELAYGDFSRSLALPGSWDVERAEAKFEHGVLTLRIPKAEAAKPRKIEVQVAG